MRIFFIILLSIPTYLLGQINWEINTSGYLTPADASTAGAVVTGAALSGTGKAANPLDVATDGINATHIASSGVNAGTYGSATAIPIVTIDQDGRITVADSVALAAGADGYAVFNTAKDSLIIFDGTGAQIDKQPILQDPMTATGDLIFRDGTNATTVLSRGADNTVLKVNGGNINYEFQDAADVINTPSGNIIGNTVQLAINELDAEKADTSTVRILGDSIDVHRTEINALSANSHADDDVETVTGTLVDNTDARNPVINTPVTQVITDGVTATAPSEDAVFDALALKVNVSDTLAMLLNYPTKAEVLSSTITDGQIFVGNASNVATGVTMSGDVTITNAGVADITADAVTGAEVLNESLTGSDIQNASITALDLATNSVGDDELINSGVTAGTYGSATNIPALTINEDGRVTSAINISISPIQTINTLTPDGSGNFNLFFDDAQTTGVSGFYTGGANQLNMAIIDASESSRGLVNTGTQIFGGQKRIRSTSGSQLQLQYDATNLVNLNVNAGGNFEITTSGNYSVFDLGDQVVFGTSPPVQPNAAYIFQSTTGSLVVPVMTTTQRDAFTTNYVGGIIYNSTDSKFNFRQGAAWVEIGSGESTTVTDGNTVDFTLTGSDITAEVDIDPSNANIITANASGLKAGWGVDRNNTSPEVINMTIAIGTLTLPGTSADSTIKVVINNSTDIINIADAGSRLVAGVSSYPLAPGEAIMLIVDAPNNEWVAMSTTTARSKQGAAVTGNTTLSYVTHKKDVLVTAASIITFPAGYDGAEFTIFTDGAGSVTSWAGTGGETVQNSGTSLPTNSSITYRYIPSLTEWRIKG